MIRTRVGYAGGTVPDPTYDHIGDHSESIQIDYDPDVISYADLLDVFWQAHHPVTPAYVRQYASLILYHDKEQRRLAEESKQREEERSGGRLYTEILPLTTFYPAEDYHQKYELRGNPALLRTFVAIYPDPDDLRDSTAAACVNAYIAGYGTLADLEADRAGLGLPPDAYEELAGIVGRRHR